MPPGGTSGEAEAIDGRKHARTHRALEQLIAALDRRVARVEPDGEAVMARDSRQPMAELASTPSDFVASAPALFNCEQTPGRPPRYARDMPLERIKWALTAAWVTAAVVLGLFVRGDLTWQTWAAFIALAVLPPAALLFWWTDPAQTMSETINDVRRKTWPS